MQTYGQTASSTINSTINNTNKELMESILIRKILLKLFRIEDDRLVMNNLYFMDKELVEMFKRLQTLNYHDSKE